MPYLKVEKGPGCGQIYEFEDSVLIGRDRSCGVQLVDETASRQHVRLILETGCWRVEDLESSNGVRVNGNRVTSADLVSSDRIQIGATVLRFEQEGLTERQTVVLGGEAGSGHSVVSVVREREDPLQTRRDEKVGEHLERLRKLLQAARGCRDSIDLDAFSRDFFGALVDGLAPDRGHFRFYSASGDTLFEKTLQVEGAVSGRAVLSESLQEEVVRKRQAIQLDAQSDGERRSIVKGGIATALAVPFLQGKSVCGLVYLDRVGAADPFGPQDLSFVASLVDQLTPQLIAALRVTELERLSHPERPFLGESPAMQEVFERIHKVAAARTNVLLVGETGTGKELVTRAIHREGEGEGRPLVAVNCSAIPADLMESEFFGHVRGAFTGAATDRRGCFQQADGGTLFLDEVAEIPMGLQAKLLRALEEGEIRPVGSDDPVRVDVRVVSATATDLAGKIEAGEFRNDLYYRLAVLDIKLPPLRERGEDLELLVFHFLEQLSGVLDREPPSIERDALEALREYSWPGNVRELRNVLERALVLGEGSAITRNDLPELRGVPCRSLEDGFDPGRLLTLKEAEEMALRRALAFTRGKKGEAVRILGTTWPTLNKKIKEYGIEVPSRK